MGNHLQLDKLKDEWKRFKWWRFAWLKFWIADIRFAHERCSYCGLYLHPQSIFPNIKTPQKLTYWDHGNHIFVCSKCHYLKQQLYGG